LTSDFSKNFVFVSKTGGFHTDQDGGFQPEGLDGKGGFERGEKAASIDSLVKIAKALGVKVRDLVNDI
jgi:hypothetical protein